MTNYNTILKASLLSSDAANSAERIVKLAAKVLHQYNVIKFGSEKSNPESAYFEESYCRENYSRTIVFFAKSIIGLNGICKRTCNERCLNVRLSLDDEEKILEVAEDLLRKI